MSIPRACKPCRGAKAKCDLSRPACGRCQARRLECVGLPPDERFIFLDENERAQRNSERARRERGIAWSPLSFEIGPACRPVLAPDTQQAHPSTQIPTLDLKQLYPWLNSRAQAGIPTPLSVDHESRAIDRFFDAWTLFPGNDGLALGHLHELRALYLSASPNSILGHAVRAMAFADKKNHYSADVPFTTRALRHYGSALQNLQNIVDNGQLLTDDRVLAAMLLIDSFESLYLGRTDPLGPHFDAVMHVLNARGDEQFFDRTGFALWHVAHHRLLTRQISLRESPSPEQFAWLSKLDVDNISLHISSDVLRMSSLASAAKTLLSASMVSASTAAERIDQARQLESETRDLLASIKDWTESITGAWKPELKDSDEVVQSQETDYSSTLPIPDFKCPKALSYRDKWIGYMWNFHAAAQIVLRESLVEVADYAASLQSDGPVVDDMERFRDQQRDSVHILSSTIIRTFPQLLGFMHRETQGPYILPHGKMAGRFFSIFALGVVRTARFTSDEHKQTATEVIEWIHSSHGLA